MATSGQTDTRSLYIEKKVREYEEEASILKGMISVVSTPSREIRYYQKTSGYLAQDSPINGMKVAEGSQPFVLESSWTRNTAYVKKYFVESPLILMEDESDTDVQVFNTNARDLVEGLKYEEDGDIWEVATESQSPTNINSITATAGWDAASGQDPFADLMDAKKVIRQQTKRNLKRGVLLINAKSERDLLVWLVTTKGASIPNYSSDKVQDGSLLNIAGLSTIVSENVTADYALVGDLSQAVEYRQFMPIKTAIIKEDLIGRKIRISEHGVALLVKPKFLTLIGNVDA